MTWFNFGLIFGGSLSFCQKIWFLLKGLKFSLPTLIIHLDWPTPKTWAQSDLVWFFWGGASPLFCQKSDFGWGWQGGKIFITNFYHLFVLAYPENLSSTGLGLIFGGFLGRLPPFPPTLGLGGGIFSITNLDHLFCLWGKFFHHQLWSFIWASLLWKFELNWTKLIFRLILGVLAPVFFCKKNCLGELNFYPQPKLFIGAGLPWKFELN